MTPPTILNTLDDPGLFAPAFAGYTWGAWRAALAALFGLPATEAEAALYRQHTGRAEWPAAPAEEGWLIVGRRGGKSRLAALVAVYLACFRDYRGVLAPGERGTVMLLAADRRQARGLMRYVTGLLDGCPMLAPMVAGRTSEAVTLTNRIVIEIHTSSYRAVRGYTVIAAVCDEIAFWRSEESANPDVEILNALRPAMATVPGALLLCISSPYARRGVLWEAYRTHYSQDADPVLLWQAPTRVMNPAVPEAVVRAAYAADEAAAAAEYGAEFRRDLEDYVSLDALGACVAPGLRELPPRSGVRYHAFVDPSGGARDSMTLALAHWEGGRASLDCLRERRAPFDPTAVVADFAAVLRPYGVTRVVGDRYAGEWPRAEFRKHGIGYEPAEASRSELYLALLPAIMSRTCQLLDHPRLLAQLGQLERRTSRAGRDQVDHGPQGADDLANAAAGALGLALGRGTQPVPVAGAVGALVAGATAPGSAAGDIPAGIALIGEPIRTAGVGWAGRPRPAAGHVGGQADFVRRRY